MWKKRYTIQCECTVCTQLLIDTTVMCRTQWSTLYQNNTVYNSTWMYSMNAIEHECTVRNTMWMYSTQYKHAVQNSMVYIVLKPVCLTHHDTAIPVVLDIRRWKSDKSLQASSPQYLLARLNTIMSQKKTYKNTIWYVKTKTILRSQSLCHCNLHRTQSTSHDGEYVQ